jgi:hypothetical protein
MSKILNLKKYDIVFTTSFETNHGITGHIFEMIEYYTVCKHNNINAGLALLDGVTIDLLEDILYKKYNFSKEEITDIISNTVVLLHPYIIMANALCIVDGAPSLKSCVVYADNVFLLRCWDGPLDYYSNSKSIKQTHLLQDFSMYTERYEDLNIKVVDYNKKLLWNRYNKPKAVKTNTAMFYMMNRCKAIDPEDVAKYIDKHKFDRYLIITDTPDRYKQLLSDNVSIEVAPIANLFEKFDTYIYTPVTKVDCSPRFIVECAVFEKTVIYEHTDAGVAARQRGISAGIESLLLTSNDFFVQYVKQYI